MLIWRFAAEHHPQFRRRAGRDGPLPLRAAVGDPEPPGSSHENPSGLFQTGEPRAVVGTLDFELNSFLSFFSSFTIGLSSVCPGAAGHPDWFTPGGVREREREQPEQREAAFALRQGVQEVGLLCKSQLREREIHRATEP